MSAAAGIPTGIRPDGDGLLVDGELNVRGAAGVAEVRAQLVRPDPGDGVTRGGFSASGEINWADFGVCSNKPYLGLASGRVHLDVTAEVVLRSQQ